MMTGRVQRADQEFRLVCSPLCDIYHIASGCIVVYIYTEQRWTCIHFGRAYKRITVVTVTPSPDGDVASLTTSLTTTPVQFLQISCCLKPK